MSEIPSLQELPEKVVHALMNYCESGTEKKNLLDVISAGYILNTIEKDQFAKLQMAFMSTPLSNGVGILEFVKIFAELNDFKPEEDLFHFIAVIELYQLIQQNMRAERNISFADFTDFHYEYFQEKDGSNYKIPTYQMPPQRKIKQDFHKARDIDLNPAVIVGRNDQGITLLNSDTLRFDSKKHREDNSVKGQYSSVLRAMITLDAFSGQLNMYNTNAQITRTIKPKAFSPESITLILSFAWSNIEQRIGACLKDSSLVFWELSDNFEFQKQFSTVQFYDDYQSDIWYLEHSRLWVTTSRANTLCVWNLSKENLDDVIPTNKFVKGTIIKVVEITHLRLVGVASMDKQVTVWNLFEKQMVLALPLTNSGIHHLVYSYNFQILLTAGFESIVHVFSIHPNYYEYKLEGQLIGHSSMITAVQEITNTEVVVTADDQGTLKIWDVRTFTCIQNINLFIKAQINSIIYIQDQFTISLLTSRVGFMNFDIKSSEEQQQGLDAVEESASKVAQIYPIHVEFDGHKGEFVVCSSKDVRVFDAKTGRKKRIVKGLLSDASSSEITHFRFINQQQHFVISNDRGINILVDSNNTENQLKLSGHVSEVSSAHIDYKNKQLVSSGREGSMIIQAITKGAITVAGQNTGAPTNGNNSNTSTNVGFEVKRTLKNAHFGKGINILEFSYYLNLIATATDSNEVFIYDYEYLKCVGTIHLGGSVIPTAMHFIPIYSLLAVCSSNGMLYVFYLQLKDHALNTTLLGIIDLLRKTRQTQDILFHQLANLNQNSMNNLNLNTSQNGNTLINTFNTSQISSIPHSNFISLQSEKTSANPTITPHNENGVGSSSTHSNHGLGLSSFPKCSPNRIAHKISKQLHIANCFQQAVSDPIRIKNKQNQQNQQQQLDMVDESVDYGVKIVSIANSEEHKKISKKQDTNLLRIYVGRTNGEIDCFDLTELLTQQSISVKPSYDSSKTNFNPSRVSNEIFKEFSEKAEESRYQLFGNLLSSQQQIVTMLTQSSQQIITIKSIAAHKQSLHSLQLMQIDRQNLLVSCSRDGYFRIWDDKLKLQTSMNINHPLPMQWKMNITQTADIHKKLFFAVKVLELASKKYQKEEVASKFLNAQKFLASIVTACSEEATSSTGKDRSIMLTQPTFDPLTRRKQSQSMNFQEIEQQQQQPQQQRNLQIKTMNDFFTPDDLQFDKLKNQFTDKLRGPTLKQMESIKRINEMKQKGIALMAVQHNKADDEEVEKKMRQNDDRENVFFLLPQYRDRVLKRTKEEFNDASEFQKKLEAHQLYLNKQAIKAQQQQQLQQMQQQAQASQQPSQMQQSQQQNFRPSLAKPLQLSSKKSSEAYNSNNNVNISNNNTSNKGLSMLNSDPKHSSNMAGSLQSDGFMKNSFQQSNGPLSGMNSTKRTTAYQLPNLDHTASQNLSTGYHPLSTKQVFLSSCFCIVFDMGRTSGLIQSKTSLAKKSSNPSSPIPGDSKHHDFFAYASQKHLYLEAGARYRSQLEELSANTAAYESKAPKLLENITKSMNEDNLIGEGTSTKQVDFGLAKTLNTTKNKLHLLKRMQEKTKMNDILRNLDKQLSQSKISSSTRPLLRQPSLSSFQPGVTTLQIFKNNNNNNNSSQVEDITIEQNSCLYDSHYLLGVKILGKHNSFQEPSYENKAIQGNQLGSNNNNNSTTISAIHFNCNPFSSKIQDYTDQSSSTPTNLTKGSSERKVSKHHHNITPLNIPFSSSTRALLNNGNASLHNHTYSQLLSNNNNTSIASQFHNSHHNTNTNTGETMISFLNKNPMNRNNTTTSSIHQHVAGNSNNNIINTSAILSLGLQQYYNVESYKVPSSNNNFTKLKRIHSIKASRTSQHITKSLNPSQQTTLANISQLQ